MALAVTIPDRAALDHRGLAFWMKRALEQLAVLRSDPNPHVVHDLRVALRRCRSVAATMEEVDPHCEWEEMRGCARRLFRSLGELRDAHILRDWLDEITPNEDPIKHELTESLKREEEAALQKALQNAAHFDVKRWKKLQRSLRARVRRVPPDSNAAFCLALERLEEAKDLHRRALRTERSKPWHRLRIGIKHFRYTVESFAPALHQKWSESLKRIQDVLGDIHDLDVLSGRLSKANLNADPVADAAWQARIAHARQERLQTYRQLALGDNGVWKIWSGGFPARERSRYASARIAATRKAMDPKPQKSLVLSRIALRLYSQLRADQVAPPFLSLREREVLAAAARLSGIRKSSGRKHHVKSARAFLLASPVPPGWSFAEWERMAWAIRFLRGHEPGVQKRRFSRLSPEQRAGISLHSGILRFARALQKCGVASGKGVRLECLPQALLFHVAGFEECPKNAALLSKGKRLLETILARSILVQPEANHDRIPKAPELPLLAFAAAR